MDKTAKKRLKIDLRFGGLAIDLHRFEFQRIGFAVVGIADLCRNIVQGRCEEIHYRIVAAPHPIFDDFGFHAAYAVFSCTRLIQTADGIKFFAVGDFQPRGEFRVICRQLPGKREQIHSLGALLGFALARFAVSYAAVGEFGFRIQFAPAYVSIVGRVQGIADNRTAGLETDIV